MPLMLCHKGPISHISTLQESSHPPTSQDKLPLFHLVKVSQWQLILQSLPTSVFLHAFCWISEIGSSFTKSSIVHDGICSALLACRKLPIQKSVFQGAAPFNQGKMKKRDEKARVAFLILAPAAAKFSPQWFFPTPKCQFHSEWLPVHIVIEESCQSLVAKQTKQKKLRVGQDVFLTLFFFLYF